MKMMRFPAAAVLAVTLLASLGSITAPQLSMFSAPAFSIGHTGFNQLSPSEIGQAPIIFAPSSSELLHGGGVGTHFTPVLETSSWVPSMKTSGINQMFAMMSNCMKGTGKKK